MEVVFDIVGWDVGETNSQLRMPLHDSAAGPYPTVPALSLAVEAFCHSQTVLLISYATQVEFPKSTLGKNHGLLIHRLLRQRGL